MSVLVFKKIIAIKLILWTMKFGHINPYPTNVENRVSS